MSETEPNVAVVMRDGVRERFNYWLTSPLLGAFALAWAAVNIKLLAVLCFSTGDASQKLAELVRLYNDASEYWWKFIWLPLIAALVSLFLGSILERAIAICLRYVHGKAKQLQMWIDGSTPITQKEAKEIYRKLWEAEERHNEEINLKDDEIWMLKKEIHALRTTKKNSAQTLSVVDGTRTDSQW